MIYLGALRSAKKEKHKQTQNKTKNPSNLLLIFYTDFFLRHWKAVRLQDITDQQRLFLCIPSPPNLTLKELSELSQVSETLSLQDTGDFKKRARVNHKNQHQYSGFPLLTITSSRVLISMLPFPCDSIHPHIVSEPSRQMDVKILNHSVLSFPVF